MLKAAHRVLASALCAFVTACDTTTPTQVGLAGQWSGTTSQGTPISFTVSADEKVTSITVGYSFNGCSGSQTFANLNVETAPNVACIPGPCPPSISSYRAFGYSAGPREGPSTSVNGLFLPMGRAEGLAGFRDYPDCGTALGIAWTATRR